MKTGWQDENGKRVFRHEGTGEILRDAWIEWQNAYYHLKPDGDMARSEWVENRWLAADGRYDPDIHRNSSGWTTASRVR